MSNCIARVPMILCFIIAALILTGSFTAALWVTLNNSATTSVSRMADHLHVFLIDQLTDRLLGVFDSMVKVLMGWSSADDLAKELTPHVMKFTYEFITKFADLKFLAIVRADGSFAGSFRMPSGEVVSGDRGASVPNQTTNLTYYHIGSNFTVLSPAIIVSSELRTLPHYMAAVTHGKIAFSVPWTSAADSSRIVTCSLPIFGVNGELDVVAILAYPFSSFATALESARTSLQSSGMLVLLGNDDSPIAYSTASPSTLSGDIAEIRKLVATRNLPPGAISHETFGTFGSSLFFQLEFSDTSAYKPPAAGLSWKLYGILPLDDYYGNIWHDNGIVGIYTAVYFTIFLISLSLTFHVLISRPVKSLTEQLNCLAEAIRSTSNLVPQLHFGSLFMEFRQLYSAAADAIAAQKEAAEVRSDELARAASAAQASERETVSMMQAKEMFFAVMSHEMRTPLTACIGMAEILLETTDLTDHQAECLNAILCSGSSMLFLVNDVLDLSKIQADRMMLENLPFNLRMAIEDLIGMLQIRAEEKGLDLVSCIRAGVPSEFVGDQHRLSQVLLNIMANAIKFTPTGTVSLVCSKSLDGSAVEFEIIDTGIGMTPECLARLFQPFTQGDVSMTRRFGGTGLGLTISKKLVELMGGTIQMRSDGENQGCRVLVRLPIKSPGIPNARSEDRLRSLRAKEKQLELREITIVGEPQKMLIIDSNPLLREGLLVMLRQLRFEASEAESVEQLSANPDCDGAQASIVLVRLPTDPTLVPEVENALKRLPRTCTKDRRVVWITPLKPDRNVELPADRITLPLTLSKLRNALFTAADGSAVPRSISGMFSGSGDSRTSSCSPPPSQHSTHVLVVDDVAVNQRVLGLKLQQHGFDQIDYASNGREAVAAVQAAPFVYGFILMDVMMPEMNGYEATKAIRADPRYAHIPIIGITGNCSVNDIRQCIESGMTTALGKPVDTEKLFAIIKQKCRWLSAKPPFCALSFKSE